ncbi:MAG: tetratricopeptide repeat protein [Prevotella sp.]|nr:tetratricopeptide repeat protein [Prevotella sp.]
MGTINNKVLMWVMGVSLLHLFTFSPLMAQPGWVKKATKSVFTVKTFSADGSLIGSSNGFFTGTDGEAISNFTPFKGASRAVIIDAAGKEIPVSAIMGANDMYDVVKFRVATNKTQPLTIATEVAPTGSTVWLLPYRETKVIKSGAVRKAETFQEEYAYYTVAMQTPETAVSCPLLNEAGEVIGLMQQPASATDSLSYAVSARFVDSLKVTGLSLSDPALKMTAIKKELPSTLDETNLLIYLASTSVDSVTYAGLVNDMIEKYPQAPDGYLYRAELAANATKYAEADKDMTQALKVAKDGKDEVLFSYARMIYNKEIYQNNLPYEPWSLDKALSNIQEANGINPQPGYQQLEGNILFAQKKYDEAYHIFTELTNTSLDKAELWYSASRCKEMQKDTTAMLALLDSAVCTFSKPYLKQAAPYLWTRGNKRFDCGKYRDAVADFNEYEQLMATQVNARFYYIRHQAEVEGRLYQQALNDLDRAMQMEPKETLYRAEKASLLIRVGKYDDAIEPAEECITLEPDGSNGYLLKGLALCLKGNKKEGLELLGKAKDMGDPQADTLIEKYK